MCVTFNVMQEEYRSRSGRKLAHGLVYRFGHETSLGIRFRVVRRSRCIILDIYLHFCNSTNLAQRIERSIYGNSVRPCSELRITTVAWKRTKDLDPHFLRDVRGKIAIAAQAEYHGIYVRRVLHPELAEGTLIARHRPLHYRLLRGHPVCACI